MKPSLRMLALLSASLTVTLTSSTGCYRFTGVVTCVDGACPAGLSCDVNAICRDPRAGASGVDVNDTSADDVAGEGELDIGEGEGEGEGEAVVPGEGEGEGEGEGDGEGDDGIIANPNDCASVPSALLCDGFESGSLSSWSTLDVDVDSGSLEVSSAQAFTGSFAMRAEMGDASEALAVYSIAQGPEDLWFRARIFVPSEENITIPVSLATFGNRFGDPLYLDLDGTDDLYVYTRSDYDDSDSVDFPRDAWACVEVHLELNPSGEGLLELYLDGALEAVEENTGTFGPSEITEVSIGVDTATLAPFTVFFDDVVIAGERVPCAP